MTGQAALARRDETVAGAPALRPARPVVCVQGLGFVGAAMALAVAQARGADGGPAFDVIGVELPTLKGRHAVAELSAGRFPFEAGDPALAAAAMRAHAEGCLTATLDQASYAAADVILVDVNFDLDFAAALESGAWGAQLDFAPLEAAVRAIGKAMKPGALVIVETTVPPGTCERVVAPLLAECLAARGLAADGFLLAHSYERVMPGPDYLSSITDYWRVYAGLTEAAAEACEAFLSHVLNVRDYPLCRLASPTASETAKVLENSYRAANIALIDEWSRFAEAAGIDLYEVIAAIRRRPTHANIREPGFGVGGYCLPKDPLLALAAADRLFGRPDLDFPFARLAVATNRRMPCATLDLVAALLDGELAGRTLLLLGVSYRSGVADTRFAPAATFVAEAESRGACVLLHDPLVRHWPELGRAVAPELPPAQDIDAVVLAVAHPEYRHLDIAAWLGSATPAVIDAADLLDAAARADLRRRGCAVASLGRGRSL